MKSARLAANPASRGAHGERRWQAWRDRPPLLQEPQNFSPAWRSRSRHPPLRPRSASAWCGRSRSTTSAVRRRCAPARPPCRPERRGRAGRQRVGRAGPYRQPGAVLPLSTTGTWSSPQVHRGRHRDRRRDGPCLSPGVSHDMVLHFSRRSGGGPGGADGNQGHPDHPAGAGGKRGAARPVPQDPDARAELRHAVPGPGQAADRPARAGGVVRGPAGHHGGQPDGPHRHGAVLPGDRSARGRLRDSRLRRRRSSSSAPRCCAA